MLQLDPTANNKSDSDVIWKWQPENGLIDGVIYQESGKVGILWLALVSGESFEKIRPYLTNTLQRSLFAHQHERT